MKFIKLKFDGISLLAYCLVWFCRMCLAVMAVLNFRYINPIVGMVWLSGVVLFQPNLLKKVCSRIAWRPSASMKAFCMLLSVPAALCYMACANVALSGQVSWFMALAVLFSVLSVGMLGIIMMPDR